MRLACWNAVSAAAHIPIRSHDWQRHWRYQSRNARSSRRQRSAVPTPARATDTRLRVGRAIGKTEEQVAHELMAQLKDRGHPNAPPAMATDGKGDYREALLETWGQVPEYI